MNADSAVVALAALAQRSRLAVFRTLVQRGPDGELPGMLAQLLALAPATLSFHLKALSHAGLVEAEPSGRQIRYRANFDAMRDLLGYLTQNCCAGERASCAPPMRRAPGRRLRP